MDLGEGWGSEAVSRALLEMQWVGAVRPWGEMEGRRGLGGKRGGRLWTVASPGPTTRTFHEERPENSSRIQGPELLVETHDDPFGTAEMRIPTPQGLWLCSWEATELSPGLSSSPRTRPGTQLVPTTLGQGFAAPALGNIWGLGGRRVLF